MGQERPTLFEVERGIRERLAAAEEPQRADASALIVAAGSDAVTALEGLIADEALWAWLASDPDGAPENPEWPRVWDVLDSGWVPLLDALGYRSPPPPSAEGLANELLGELMRLVAAPEPPGVALAKAGALRADLQQFVAELNAILLRAPEIPEALRARALIGPVSEAREVVWAVGPATIAAAAGLALGGPIPALLAPAVVGVVERRIAAFRARRRDRTLDEWRAQADAAMARLAAAVEGIAPASVVTSEALGAAAALRRLEAAGGAEGTAAREALSFVAAVRRQAESGEAVPAAFARAIGGWRGLVRGAFRDAQGHELARRRQEELQREAERRAGPLVRPLPIKKIILPPAGTDDDGDPDADADASAPEPSPGR